LIARWLQDESIALLFVGRMILCEKTAAFRGSSFSANSVFIETEFALFFFRGRIFVAANRCPLRLKML